MKALACSGDVEGFYSNIDRASVENRLKKTALEKISEGSSDQGALLEYEKVVIPSLIVLNWEVINRELEKGVEGAFCNMQVLDHSDGDNSIKIILPEGKISTWGFDQSANKMVLVSMIDEDPFDFADIDLEMKQKEPSLAKSNINTANKISEEIKQGEPEENKEPAISKAQDNSDGGVLDKVVEDQQEVQIDALAKESEPTPEPEPQQSQEKTSSDREETKENRSAAVSNGYYDFGSARWGMTKGQVISSEASSPVSESGDSLTYMGQYNGASASLVYVFSGDRLVKGRYKVNGSSSDQEAYIGQYERLKEILTARFGAPIIDDMRWVNPLYKDNPDRYGFAVYIGHLSYMSKWITPRSNIVLELESNNYNMILQALYNN